MWGPVDSMNTGTCEVDQVSTENTSENKTSQDSIRDNVENSEYGYISRGRLCRLEEVRRILGASRETVQLWREAGLRTARPGTRTVWVLTDEVIEFLLNNPKLGERPSAKRKARLAQKGKRE